MSASFDRAGAYRVFSDALERPVSERAAFLAARCGNASALRETVERLLAIAERDAAVTGVLLEAVAPSADVLVGREYGPFRLRELLGAGGMGTVYRAERTDGIPQTVAVKILRDGVSAAQRCVCRRAQPERLETARRQLLRLHNLQR
jgi:serine/threonine protein kinase